MKKNYTNLQSESKSKNDNLKQNYTSHKGKKIIETWMEENVGHISKNFKTSHTINSW